MKFNLLEIGPGQASYRRTVNCGGIGNNVTSGDNFRVTLSKMRKSYNGYYSGLPIRRREFDSPLPLQNFWKNSLGASDTEEDNEKDCSELC